MMGSVVCHMQRSFWNRHNLDVLFMVLANQLIELNSNENSLGMSDAAKQAVIDALDIGFRYPDDQRAALITKVADINVVTEHQISLGSGSSENIRTVIQMLKNKAEVLKSFREQGWV
ncbi:hypothetical protein ABE212_00470 [Psychrobacter pacificensis]|uniref:hypothetical protein n=1 Tax=Psychrobacter TaxID=497 RepID=UPI003C2E7BE4